MRSASSSDAALTSADSSSEAETVISLEVNSRSSTCSPLPEREVEGRDDGREIATGGNASVSNAQQTKSEPTRVNSIDIYSGRAAS